MAAPIKVCKQCRTGGSGKFCAMCGQEFQTKRLSLGTIFHEAFHFFTHLDHGFPYTLKRLFTSPGTMQREYIDGLRHSHQKPFSMFFLCATIAALAMYWINLLLIKHFDAGDSQEGLFFQKYWVILQVLLLPFFALITYFVFKKSKLNYGEIIVFQLYQFSFLFVVVSLVHLLKFIFPHFQTRYIEFPVIIVYTIITHLNFFKGMKKWIVISSTVFAIGFCFLLASYIQDLLVKIFS